jgi:uncharacterized protein (DUF2236 family)
MFTVAICVIALLVLWFLKEIWSAYRFIRSHNHRLEKGSTESKFVSPPPKNYEYKTGFSAFLDQIGEDGIMGTAPNISHEILRESITWMTISPLLLMQISYPPIAFALERHSTNFTGLGLYLRSIETVIYAHKVLFKPKSELKEISDFVFRTHAKVKGVIPEDTGPFKKGDTYDGLDQKALAWVFATSVDYAIAGHELFVRKLSDAEKDTHYKFIRKTAPVWGLDPDQLPSDWDSFTSYMSSMVRSGILAETQPAKFIVANVFRDRLVRKLQAFALVPEGVRKVLEAERSLLLSCPAVALIRMVYKLLPVRFRQLKLYGEWHQRNKKTRDAVSAQGSPISNPDYLERWGNEVGSWIKYLAVRSS